MTATTLWLQGFCYRHAARWSLILTKTEKLHLQYRWTWFSVQVKNSPSLSVSVNRTAHAKMRTTTKSTGFCCFGHVCICLCLWVWVCICLHLGRCMCGVQQMCYYTTSNNVIQCKCPLIAASCDCCCSLPLKQCSNAP